MPVFARRVERKYAIFGIMCLGIHDNLVYEEGSDIERGEQLLTTTIL